MLFEFEFKQFNDENFERLIMTVHTVPSQKVTDHYEWIRVDDSVEEEDPPGWYKMRRVTGGKLVHFDKIAMTHELMTSRDTQMRQMYNGNDFTIDEQVIASIEHHSNKLKGPILDQSRKLGELFRQQCWNFAMVLGPLIRSEPEGGAATMAYSDGVFWTKVEERWICHLLPRDASLDVQFRPNTWKMRLFAD